MSTRIQVALITFSLASLGSSHAFEREAILLEVRVGGERIEQRGVAGGFVDGWGPTLVSGGTLATIIAKDLSRSAGRSGGLLAKIRAAQEEIRLQKLALFGNWKSVIKLLQPLRDDLPNYVIPLAADPDTRTAAFEAMVLLARAYYGAQESERALDIVNDLVRDYPDQQVNDELTRGPEFLKFYQSAAAQEAKRPHFALRVESDVERCGVYVNELKAGTGTRVERKVTAGRYRVFVYCPDGRASRVHEVNVEANVPVTVNLRFDSVLDATNDYVALNFKSEADRAASEIAYASVIGRALQARRVVTLGLEVDARTGLPRLVGRVIDPTREAQVSSHTTTVAAGVAPPFGVAKDLGNRLRLKQENAVSGAEPERQEPMTATTPSPAGARANPAVNVVREPAPAAPRRPLPAWPGWVVAGLAAGGIAVGAAFLAVDGQQSCEYPSTVPAGVQCPKVFDTRSQGIAYTTLGVAFLAAGITWGVVNTVKKRH